MVSCVPIRYCWSALLLAITLQLQGCLEGFKPPGSGGGPTLTPPTSPWSGSTGWSLPPGSSSLQPPAPPVASKTCGKVGSRGRNMNCGPGVPLCGVLTLQMGLGEGVYSHPEPVVHGLWPQVEGFGSSQCIAPQKSDVPTQILYSCFDQKETPNSKDLWFQTHEWTNHGTCAGTVDAADFFQQLCDLAAGPLAVMAKSRSNNLKLDDTADALQNAGYCVWRTGSEQQVQLSACAGSDGKWKLADVSDFSKVCGPSNLPPSPNPPSAKPSPTPSVPTPSPPGSQPSGGVDCNRQKGPKCNGDSDCAGVSGCVRCAKSGFCTHTHCN